MAIRCLYHTGMHKGKDHSHMSEHFLVRKECKDNDIALRIKKTCIEQHRGKYKGTCWKHLKG